MMKIVIFGTGRIYQKRKNELYDYIEIVAFIDNNREKQGQVVDGVPVLAPKDVDSVDYDYILIMAAAYEEMHRQLIDQGVDVGRIIRPELEYKVFCNDEKRYCSIGTKLLPQKGKHLLAISHALTCTGAQNVLMYAIKILVARGFSVVVIAIEDGELRSKLEEMGVSIVLCNDFRLENSSFNRLIMWSDYILINTLWLQYMVRDIAMSGKPVFWWLHESGALDSVGTYEMKQALQIPNVYIYSVSSVVVKYIDKKCEIKSNIPLLCFGLPEYEIYDKCKEDKMIFINIGPYAWIKGQDILIKAIDSLEDKYKQHAEFYFYGGGEPDGEIKKLVEHNDCIRINGRVDNSLMPQIYSVADATICSSREESMSVVVMEGFMNSIPGIVSDITGITDYMTDGTDGLIFPSENVQALKEAIIKMIENRSKTMEMGREGRHTYERNFTLGAFEDKLINVFKRMDDR